MEIKLKPQRTSFVTWAIFLGTLITALISLIPAVFPALLLRSFGGLEDFAGINPFELGIWAYPLLISNFVLLGLVFLYVKKRLPQLITKSIRFIFNFEVSKKGAFFVIVILIGLYATLTVGELFDGKYQADYEVHFKDWFELYDVTKFDVTPIGNHVLFFLVTSSMQVFQNYKVIPLIASIALLVLTYLFTVEISKKRFAGIVAMVIVLQSNIFLMYDTSVTYANFWILFYLLSLYLVIKKWSLSPISYLAAVFSKPMSAAFLPMTLFFIYRANISKKQKIQSVIFYAIILISVLALISTVETKNLEYFNEGFEFGKFSAHDFWDGFASLYVALRFDGLVLLFLLPLVLGLFYASRRGIAHADSIMFLILGILLSSPLIHGLSSFIIVPYRLIPLIVFFAIGTGILLSRNVRTTEFPKDRELTKETKYSKYPTISFHKIQSIFKKRLLYVRTRMVN